MMDMTIPETSRHQEIQTNIYKKGERRQVLSLKNWGNNENR